MKAVPARGPARLTAPIHKPTAPKVPRLPPTAEFFRTPSNVASFPESGWERCQKHAAVPRQNSEVLRCLSIMFLTGGGATLRSSSFFETRPDLIWRVVGRYFSFRVRAMG